VEGKRRVVDQKGSIEEQFSFSGRGDMLEGGSREEEKERDSDR